MIKHSQIYHYTESGLRNVYLVNVDLRMCEQCHAATPRIPKILKLHETIGRAVALQPYPLNGGDVRFLRKQLGLKAREWATLLRIDHTTLSRWENEEQKIGPQSDALVRHLYFRLLEERSGRLIVESVAERIAAQSEERFEDSGVFVNMNNPSVYSYQRAEASIA